MFMLSLRLRTEVRLVAGLLYLLALPAVAQNHWNPATPASPLRYLITATLAQNPGVRAARAAVDAAEARLRGADRPLYNPQLELDAEQAETRAGSVRFSQTIDWADKRGARSELANAELDTVRAQYLSVRQQLVGELLRGLARYHTAAALQGLADQRMTLMQRFLDLAEKRHGAGDLAQVELDLAQLAQTQAALQFSQSASDLAESGQALAAITGAPVNDWPALPVEVPALDGFDADSLLKKLPELGALRNRVRAAQATVSLRSRERRADPTIAVRAGQERAFRNGNDDTFGLAGVTLNIPLFVRNDFRAEVQAAGADQVQAEASLQDLYRRARARLMSAANRYRLSRGAWIAWVRTGQPSLGSQVALLERIWQAGEMSTADYLVQLNQTLDTRSNALAVRGRLWAAWSDWLVASGQVNIWLDAFPSR